MENKALFPNSAVGADDQFLEQLADITAKVIRFTSAGGSAIALVSGPVAVTKASSGNLAPDVDSELRLEGSFAGLCIQKGELLYCEDAESDSRVDPAASASLGIRSMVMVPIGEKEKVRGVLASFSALPNGFRPTHIAVMRTLADIVNELVIRQDQAHTTPILEMPVRPVERAAAPTPVPMPAVAQDTTRPSASFLPPEVERSIAQNMARETAEKTPEPVASASAAPKIEEPKPLVKDRFERPEPVGSSSGRFAAPAEPVGSSSGKFKVPDFSEPSRKEKDSLPSIVALANAQKKAEASPVEEKNDILVPAADPRLEPSTAKAAAPAKQAPIAPKPIIRETKSSAPIAPALPTFESPMFSSLEQPPSGSGLNMKIVAAIVAGVVLLGVGGWGVRSYMRSSETAKASTAASQTAQPAESASQQPAETAAPTTQNLTTQPTTQATAPAPPSNKSKEATSVEPKAEAKATSPRQQPVLVANNGSVPKRPAEQPVEAPNLAMTGKADMGALLASNKAATPTLSVKRSILSPPEIIRRVPPKFPDFARRSNSAGDRVVLNVTVGADGKVKNVNLVRGQAIFADAAINAVKQWQYRPAFLNGDPVEATVEVVVSFNSGQ